MTELHHAETRFTKTLEAVIPKWRISCLANPSFNMTKSLQHRICEEYSLQFYSQTKDCGALTINPSFGMTMTKIFRHVLAWWSCEDVCHEKTDLKFFVVIIGKKGQKGKSLLDILLWVWPRQSPSGLFSRDILVTSNQPYVTSIITICNFCHIEFSIQKGKSHLCKTYNPAITHYSGSDRSGWPSQPHLQYGKN